MRHAILLLPVLSVMFGGCQPQDTSAAPASQVRDSGDAEAYDGISAAETVRFVGTEPFWGGDVSGGAALYSTPENPDGTRFPVTRFAGNNGVSFSGMVEGAQFDLMVTPGACSDGMSDRTYPFVATLTIGGEQRNGCAWTDRQSFTGDPNP